MVKTYHVDHKDGIHVPRLYQEWLNRNILAVVATIDKTQKGFVGVKERVTSDASERIRVWSADHLNVGLEETLVELVKDLPDWRSRQSCSLKRRKC
jgi:hypothetical protein